MLVGNARSVRGRVAAVLVRFAVVTAVGAGIPWVLAALGLWGWPQPSSWYGVLLGLLGGAIVFFEMALLPRKWFRWLRVVPTKYWMWAHVWLGLVGLPVILVHAGFGFGGPLAAVTLVLFVLVTLSGVWGLILQQWLPEKLLAEVPGETVAAEMDRVGEYHAKEAIALIDSLVTAPPELDDAAAAVVTGQPAAELMAFRDSVLVPYLRHGKWSGSPLATRAECEWRFGRLREELPEESFPAVDRLERLADVRRQWDYQAGLNDWLHNWLALHLPLSVLMTGLMVVHAVRALKYW